MFRARESPLFRNATWLLAGQGCGVVLQAVYFVVLARLLGSVQYGIFIGALAFTGVVASYSSLGTGTLLLRYVSLNRSEFAVYWGNLLSMTTLLGVLLTGILRFLAPKLLSLESASLVLLAATANCFCAQLTSETARVFQAFEQMRITALLSLLTNIMRTVVAVGMLLVVHRANAWQWAVASTAISAIATSVAIGTVTFRFGLPMFRFRLFYERGTEGLGYSFATSTASVYNDVDKAMLSHYSMNAAAGVYAVAYRIVDIATIPIISIRDALLPRLFRHGRAGMTESSKLVQGLILRATLGSLLASAGMFLCAPAIPRIVGLNYSESVPALRWLCILPVFRSVHQISGSALTGAGLQNYRTTSQLIVAAFNFILNLYLIPHFGWRGAAWSSLASDAVLASLNWGALLLVRTRSCHSALSATA
jgi:O-antigen/teichoic acid export membrane protein